MQWEQTQALTCADKPLQQKKALLGSAAVPNRGISIMQCTLSKADGSMKHNLLTATSFASRPDDVLMVLKELPHWEKASYDASCHMTLL
jgi:hypothetical protein